MPRFRFAIDLEQKTVVETSLPGKGTRRRFHREKELIPLLLKK
jgi:hypothetical protein